MIVIDNMIGRVSHVAYDAHLAGYAYGILLTLGLLASRIIATSNFDLWAMLKRWNRRRRYRDVVADGYDPFTGRGTRRTVEAREVPKSPAEAQRQAKVDQIRHEISRWIAQRNMPAAADLYLELMQTDPDQALPRQHLLDIANQLAGSHRSAEAAHAYEQFLAYYGNSEHAEQVELMLGILYSRYLHDTPQAVAHLQKAAGRLSDPGQLKMCREELARLGA